MQRQKKTDGRWRQYAKTLGFETEEEMLKHLIAKNSTRRIAKRLGYSRFAITYRLKLYGIKNPRGPGGPNHTKKREIEIIKGRQAVLDRRRKEMALYPERISV